MTRPWKLIIVAAFCSAGFSVVPDDADASPVGYWTFDGNVTDQTGNGNNGVASNLTYANNVPAPLSGTNSQSGTFNGSSTNVQIAVPLNSSPLFLNDTETVTLWMEALNTDQSGQYRRNFSTASGGVGLEFQEDGTTTGMSLRVDTSAGTNQLTSIGPAYDGAWHFVAVVLNGNNVTTYLDGAVASNGTLPAGIGTGFGTTNPITFGNSDQEPSDWYTGQLANAAIYNTALTGSQISFLYAGGNPLLVPEPASLVLLGLGAAGLCVAARRLRSA